MLKRLEGKVAIVTGGSRGIGAAIAEAYAKEGAKVVISSRRLPGLEATAEKINALYPGSVFPRACHNGKVDQVIELVNWAETEIGTPNVLVNNAGTNPYFGPMLEVEWAAWDKTFDVNLKGYFEMTRQVAKRLMERGEGGSIINVASILGHNAAPLQGVYGMTKAAILSMTKTLSFELGRQKIRVNAISPGVIETRLAAILTGTPELLDAYNQRTSLGRHGQPAEIAGAAVFLASDESSYLTGQTLSIDGGYSIG